MVHWLNALGDAQVEAVELVLRSPAGLDEGGWLLRELVTGHLQVEASLFASLTIHLLKNAVGPNYHGDVAETLVKDLADDLDPATRSQLLEAFVRAGFPQATGWIVP